ncbi:Ribokinase-like protein [Thamnocephalis sphaerospora]|uniref:Ribokinase-like protein n=1 Tax=Thamnocephalis sphaerospora TaxID=78915 RepID=A0A4P9XHM8_9FUNG|nr:Ribokinase-like protein [Thamnocephalis sphaerospora]|eukprot:RKP05193.1 Ribokinase-like protein [Thamnocephalis sphaerospora]
MAIESGQVIAVPIPAEHAANGDQIQRAIDQAIREAADQNIIGKNATPFLLKRVNELTAGKSLQANIALVKNNAKIGSDIARILADRRHATVGRSVHQSRAASDMRPVGTCENVHPMARAMTSKMEGPLMVIGGCAVDMTATIAPINAPIGHSSYPGRLARTLGGVGCNIARTVRQCGIPTALVSVIGMDPNGQWANEELKRTDIQTCDMDMAPDASTAIYNAIHAPDGQLHVAVADMHIFDEMSPEKVVAAIRRARPSLVCFDGNIPASCMRALAVECATAKIPAVFEPTSIPKSLKILQDPHILGSGGIRYITPNHYELEALDEAIFGKMRPVCGIAHVPALLHRYAQQAVRLTQKIPNAVVKLGEQGVLYARAGDSFVGALLAGIAVHGPANMDVLVDIAQRAAIATLASEHAVSSQITPHLLKPSK